MCVRFAPHHLNLSRPVDFSRVSDLLKIFPPNLSLKYKQLCHGVSDPLIHFHHPLCVVLSLSADTESARNHPKSSKDDSCRLPNNSNSYQPQNMMTEFYAESDPYRFFLVCQRQDPSGRVEAIRKELSQWTQDWERMANRSRIIWSGKLANHYNTD